MAPVGQHPLVCNHLYWKGTSESFPEIYRFHCCGSAMIAIADLTAWQGSSFWPESMHLCDVDTARWLHKRKSLAKLRGTDDTMLIPELIGQYCTADIRPLVLKVIFAHRAKFTLAIISWLWMLPCGCYPTYWKQAHTCVCKYIYSYMYILTVRSVPWTSAGFP